MIVVVSLRVNENVFSGFGIMKWIVCYKMFVIKCLL